jgi:hypothetical protein
MIDMSKYKFDSGNLCVASEVPFITMFNADTENGIRQRHPMTTAAEAQLASYFFRVSSTMN